MFSDVDLNKLSSFGAVLSGNNKKLFIRKCNFEPPFVFAGNLAPSNHIDVHAFTYTQGGSFFNVSIGRYCSFAEEVVVGAAMHPTDWLSSAPFQYREDPWGWFSYGKKNSLAKNEKRKVCSFSGSKKTIIGNDVWVGRRAIIMPGVTIGDGAIIGAGAVVTKDVPPYAIVAGTPAKILRYRFDNSVVQKLLDLKWWRFGIWDLEDINFSNINEAIEQIMNRELKGDIKAYEPGYLKLDSFIL